MFVISKHLPKKNRARHLRGTDLLSIFLCESVVCPSKKTIAGTLGILRSEEESSQKKFRFFHSLGLGFPLSCRNAKKKGGVKIFAFPDAHRFPTHYFFPPPNFRRMLYCTVRECEQASKPGKKEGETISFFFPFLVAVWGKVTK